LGFDAVYLWEFTENGKRCFGMCDSSCFWNLKHALNLLPVELGIFGIKKIPTLIMCFGYTVLKTVVLRGHG
jgi:hypothetical protein